MSSHTSETKIPAEITANSTDDDVMEALFTRGDTSLDIKLPAQHLFEEKDGVSLAAQILKTVVEQVPIPEGDPRQRKARPDVTGGAHPSLSFVRLAPHDEGMVRVVVSDDPTDHEQARAEATGILSPHQQPEIHVIPDAGKRSNVHDPGYEYI